MKNLFTALSMSFSMFCALPCPCPRWDESLRHKMLLCLPAVGLALGGIWALCAWLLNVIGCPRLLTAALLTILPWLLTGFIHLDGYMDCADAILSRRDLPTRQKILKDSHVGSFAVIALAILALVSFALFGEAALSGRYWTMILIPAISRCCSVASLFRLPPMGGSSYSAMQQDHGGAAAMLVLAAALCALSVLLCGLPGLGALATLLTTLLTIGHGVRQLGGMSGDISGLGITVGEVCGVAVLVLL